MFFHLFTVITDGEHAVAADYAAAVEVYQRVVEKHHPGTRLCHNGIGQLVDFAIADYVFDRRVGYHDLDGGGSPGTIDSGDKRLAQDANEKGGQPGLG